MRLERDRQASERQRGGPSPQLSTVGSQATKGTQGTQATKHISGFLDTVEKEE